MSSRHVRADADLMMYTRTAQHSSARVIHEYSTSFGLASRLLPSRVRLDIESLYGLVRIADEIVDGAAAQAGLDLLSQRALLDALEVETERALATGYSTNLVVHSFAVTARRVGVDASLTAPFFASMRRDLDPRRLTADEVSDYIYGSAEVVGLMCLRAFLAGEVCDARQRARLELGARRLGAAFQKINFLRDLSTDWEGLGRDYFPGIDPNNRSDPGHLSDAAKSELVADIRVDLDAAAATIGELPRGCRTAVAAAHGLFSELTDRIAATPAPQLLRTRIRVPLTVKLRILLVARIRSWPEEAS